LGLDISKELCIQNLKQLLDRARSYGNFVRIEMEDHSHCQLTLDIYKELRQEYDNIGTVIQAYLFRTEDDINDLNQYKANLRLVKGAYKESSTVAFPNKSDVDKNYERIIKTHLLNGNYAGIATHDDRMIENIIQFTQQHQIPANQFEFQMLYGIRSDLQKKLATHGYKVRVYVPYGSDWFGYFMRRLAERPENLTFVLKNTFK
jgi:proline dehydrogenase